MPQPQSVVTVEAVSTAPWKSPLAGCCNLSSELVLWKNLKLQAFVENQCSLLPLQLLKAVIPAGAKGNLFRDVNI